MKEVGDHVTRVAAGDRVLGCYHAACGTCFFCMRGLYQKCDRPGCSVTVSCWAPQGTQADGAWCRWPI